MRRGLFLPIGLALSFMLAFEAHAASINVNGVRINRKCRTLKEVREAHVVHQSLDYSCGPAGLATILNYYLGDPISETEIIKGLMRTCDIRKVQARHGFSLLDLKKFAQAMGYNATGYEMDIEFLKELKKPVLVPIQFKNFRHFVVIRGIVGNRVFFADPAIGNMSMKVYKFRSIWQGGIGLVIEEGDKRVNPFFCPINYPLSLENKDLMFADNRTVMREVEKGAIRTSIFPSEF